MQQPGDVLETEAGTTIANHIVCGDGHDAVIAVGYESAHVDDLWLITNPIQAEESPDDHWGAPWGWADADRGT